MNLLQKAILSTIAYYDTLDYPLTSFEVFKYLVNPLHIAGEVDKFSKISLINIRKALESRELKKIVEEKNGFFFLKGRKKIIRTRINRQKIADQKWKKAKKIIHLLQIIPYLRMAGVSGSLALNNTRENSDFDLLIATKSKRIWLTRFFVTLFIQLIGKRRHKNFTKDRICLNHYITDKSLEIKFRSLYNAQTYAHIIPTLEIEEIYKKFQKTNEWVKNYLVFWPELKITCSSARQGNFKILKRNLLLRTIAKIGEICLNNWFGNLLENLSKRIQKKMIEKGPLVHKKGGRVTADDTQLEFHPNSQEKRILENYNKTIKNLGFPELASEKDSGLL